MSDPVTNVEIEDVLSSIRRLVTEEGRPKGRTAAADPAAPAGRLVLTPALRVAEADETPAADGQEAAGRAPLDTAQFVRHPFYGGGGADEIQFSRRHRREPEAGPAADEPERADEQPAGAGQALADPPWSDPDTTLHQAAALADDGGSADAADQEDAAAADIADTPEDPAPAAEDTGASEDTLDEPAGEEPEQAPEPAAEAPAGAELHETRSASLSAKIQALEAAIAQTADQWEPDGEVGDDYAGVPVKTMAWRDHDGHRKEMAGRFEPEPEADEADTGDEEPAGLSADEAIIDEESLRELVADIVRQELQGALGERITRNVRKLVRREIHRALTTQEFE